MSIDMTSIRLAKQSHRSLPPGKETDASHSNLQDGELLTIKESLATANTKPPTDSPISIRSSRDFSQNAFIKVLIACVFYFTWFAMHARTLQTYDALESCAPARSSYSIGIVTSFVSTATTAAITFVLLLPLSIGATVLLWCIVSRVLGDGAISLFRDMWLLVVEVGPPFAKSAARTAVQRWNNHFKADSDFYGAVVIFSGVVLFFLFIIFALPLILRVYLQLAVLGITVFAVLASWIWIKDHVLRLSQAKVSSSKKID